jgi:uncharacterized protein (DUF2164 family)
MIKRGAGKYGVQYVQTVTHSNHDDKHHTTSEIIQQFFTQELARDNFYNQCLRDSRKSSIKKVMR